MNSRKIKLTLILVLMLVPFIQAQSQRYKRIRFSLLAEPQMTWMKPDVKNVVSDGFRLGWNAGLQMDYYFQENYALSTGLRINSCGGILKYQDSIPFTYNEQSDVLMPGAKISYKLQYLEIPIGLRLKTGEMGNLSYFAQIGLDPMVNVKSRASASDNNIENEEINEEIRLFNLGFHIGAGLQHHIGGDTSLIFGIIYRNYFLDFTKDYAWKPEDAVLMNNLAFRIGVLF